jgi:hypothetical protein
VFKVFLLAETVVLQHLRPEILEKTYKNYRLHINLLKTILNTRQDGRVVKALQMVTSMAQGRTEHKK